MDDERPPVAIGHVRLSAADVKASTDYLVKLGLRPIFQREDFAVLELRGGTHLVLFPPDQPVSPGSKAPFDLMVDDVDDTHRQWTEMGLDPSAIKVGKIHSSFTVVDPSGHEITINSTHAGGRPV